MSRYFDPEAEAIAYIDRYNEKKEWGEVPLYDDLTPEEETYLDAFLLKYEEDKALIEEKENKKEVVQAKVETIGATKEEALALAKVKESQDLSVEEKLRREQKKQLDNVKTKDWLHSLHKLHPTLKIEKKNKNKTNKLATDRGM